MGKQMIISISREFGSGGHVISEQIAKDLGLKLYDKNILDEIAQEKQTDAEKLRKYEEKPKSRIFSRSVRGYTNSVEENLAQMQFEYLKKKAESGESFVVVGRCSETVLRGYEGLTSIFVSGDYETKFERIQERYGLSEEETEAKMLVMDRHRKSYHNKYSDYKWGDSRNYDLCINSSRLGLEETVATLEDYIGRRRNLLK